MALLVMMSGVVELTCVRRCISDALICDLLTQQRARETPFEPCRAEIFRIFHGMAAANLERT